MHLKIVCLFFILLGLLGCKEVTINDGHVPQEYLSLSKQLEGKYFGTFDGKQAEIQIYFEGDRPLLIYKDSYGTDLIDSSCNSKIGLLQKVMLVTKNNRYTIDQAIFGFYPGACRLIAGRTLELNFSGTNRFSVSIYDHNEYVQRCNPGGPPNYGNNCYFDQIPHYITGQFGR